MGDLLLMLSIGFTVYLTAVMVWRIGAVTAAAMNRRVFLHELVLCAVFMAFALAVRFGLFAPEKPLLLRLAAWGAAVGSVIVVAIGALIAAGGCARDKGDAEAVIVPGAALEHGEPTRDLLLRLKTAAAWAQEHPDAAVIVSGGNETAFARSEAAVMRELLLREGLPEARIVTEDRAADTRENFLFSAALTDPAKPTAVVTNGYHMRRAVRMARRAGFSRVVRLPSPSDGRTYGASLMWEIIAQINYIVNGERETASAKKTPSLRS